jgi:hypothetical protein
MDNFPDLSGFDEYECPEGVIYSDSVEDWVPVPEEHLS